MGVAISLVLPLASFLFVSISLVSVPLPYLRPSSLPPPPPMLPALASPHNPPHHPQSDLIAGPFPYTVGGIFEATVTPCPVSMLTALHAFMFRNIETGRGVGASTVASKIPSTEKDM